MRQESISATNDPLLYPWEPPSGSLLVHKIESSTSFKTSPLNPVKERRFGFANVRYNDDVWSFDSLAKLKHQPWAEFRHLVIAVGSNAAPSVMCNKFYQRNWNGSDFFPIVKARVTNMAIGYFASVAPRGYIAATPLQQRGAETIVWASWLTTDQLLALNSTEPGYSCREVSAEDFPLEILSIAEDGSEVVAERPESFYVYDADQGYILDADTREAKILTTQSEIFAYFRELSKRSEYASFAEFFAKDDREIQEGFTSPEAIARFEKLLVEHELRALPNLAPDGAIAHARDGYTAYATIPSLEPPAWEGSGRTPWLRVTSTRDVLNRSRETKVVAHPSLRQEIGTHASVTTTYRSFRNNGELETRPGVIASVDYRDDVPEGTLEADQTIRESLGIGLGEYVQLAPARVASNPVADAVCPTRYVTARVYTADHSNMETEIALVDALTLRLLGMKDGGRLVIEGCPHPDGHIPEVRVRAVAMSEEVQRRHGALTKSKTGLYANPTSHLGATSDLAPILLEKSLRNRLNLDSSQLGVVRLQASRKSALADELRELILVLLIAFIGVLSVFSNPYLAGIVTVLVLLGAFALTLVRVRGNIGAESRRSRRT